MYELCIVVDELVFGLVVMVECVLVFGVSVWVELIGFDG